MSSAQKTISLRSSDGEAFEVDEAVALQSKTIKHIIEHTSAEDGVPLPYVASDVLAMVIEYCKRHLVSAESTSSDGDADEVSDDDLKAFDAEFVKVDQETLFDLTLAAYYLNIEGLLKLMRLSVANMIKGKTRRRKFGRFSVLKTTLLRRRKRRPLSLRAFPKCIVKTMSSAQKKISLKSSDDVAFEVDEAVALQSKTIKHIIEHTCAEGGIPLLNVTSKILVMVIEYCKRHVDSAEKTSPDGAADKVSGDDLKAFDAEFVKVDTETLLDLVSAANYLNIEDLLELTCQSVANMMKGKTVEEIREFFGIINDYTPEEEEEFRRENAWAFE